MLVQDTGHSEMFTYTLVVIIVLLTSIDGREIKCRPFPCYGIGCLIGCDSPPHLENMIPTDICSNYPLSAVIWYKCDEDHHYAIGQSKCRHDGRWSKPNLHCNPIDCGPPPHYVGFITNATGTTHRSTATFSCDGEFLGTKTVTCHQNEQWLPKTVPRCHLNCRNLTDIGLSHRMPMIKHDKKLVIGPRFCKPGYKLKENITSVHCRNGRLKPKFPCEPVDCGVPQRRNGMVIEARNGTTFGSKALLRCDGTLVGNQYATCLESGKWHYGNVTCHKGNPSPMLNALPESVNEKNTSQTIKSSQKQYIKKVPEPMMADDTHVPEMSPKRSGCNKSSWEPALIFSILLGIFVIIRTY